MRVSSLALLGSSILQIASAGRTVEIINECTGTIYPAFAGPAATRTSGGQQPFGWAQPPGKTAFVTPDKWEATRLWARTGCNSDGKGCKIGACKSDSLECDGRESGRMGATLAEFTFDSSSQYGDFYDVSMIEGFNLPISIEAVSRIGKGGCQKAACGVEIDILTQCDPRLVYPPDSTFIWSCATPCLNGYKLSSTFDPWNSVWCCVENGKAMPQPGQCTKDKIPFYAAYKNMCKTGYVFAQDDNDQNAVFQCNEADYEVTFCPGGRGTGVDPLPVSAAKSQVVGNSAFIDGGTDKYIRVQATASTKRLSPILQNGGATTRPKPANFAEQENDHYPAQTSTQRRQPTNCARRGKRRV